MTSAERITLPGLRCGASPPATPKLTRHLACWAASSTSASVRPGSPPPTMTWKPAARATLASAARPEVQSTGINVRMRSPPSLRESGWMVGVPPQPTLYPRPQARGHNKFSPVRSCSASGFAAEQRAASLPRPGAYWLAKKGESRPSQGKFFPVVVLPQPAGGSGKAAAGRSSSRQRIRLAWLAARSLQAECHPRGIGHRQPAIAGERPQRKKHAVTVIAQVEDARKPDRGVPGLVPIAVPILAGEQVGDAARHRRVADLARRHQGEQGPGGLRGGTIGRLAMRDVRPVALAGLAPPAIAPLAGDQPIDCAADFGRTGIDPGGIQPGEHRPGAVDVIGAPAAKPAAVRLLLGPQISKRASHRGMICILAELDEKDEAAGTDIGGRRVEQRAVIGEGNVVQVI